jgi:CRP-like cAMP-binding protein
MNYNVHPLLLHMQQYTVVNSEDFPEILAAFRVRNVKKKEHLLVANKICNTHFFVLNGCLNMYFINNNGTRQTVQFAIENWWITDYLSYFEKRKTNFFIQAVEPAAILCLDNKNEEFLLDKFPNLEAYFRKLYQIAYGASLMRIKYQFELSKEEIYFHFTEKFPDFAQRVPQYLIASYLGLTPEYVSEIRRKQFS